MRTLVPVLAIAGVLVLSLGCRPGVKGERDQRIDCTPGAQDIWRLPSTRAGTYRLTLDTGADLAVVMAAVDHWSYEVDEVVLGADLADGSPVIDVPTAPLEDHAVVVTVLSACPDDKASYTLTVELDDGYAGIRYVGER